MIAIVSSLRVRNHLWTKAQHSKVKFSELSAKRDAVTKSARFWVRGAMTLGMSAASY